MYRDRKIVIVIPAFNVADQILLVLKGIPDFIDQIIVVDDASTDRTAQVLAGVEDQRVAIVHHSTNLGVGGAMVTGFQRALNFGADIIVKMDGDDQMDPHYLPELLDPIVNDQYVYAKGNRFLDGDQLGSMPKIRLIGNYALTFLAKLVSGYWHVFDPTNGFVAITASILKKLPLNKLSPRYFFENDMLVHLNVLNAKVKDVAIPARYGQERSSMQLNRIVMTFPVFLFMRFWYRIYQKHVLRQFSPVALFWILGSFLLMWGTAFGALTWAMSIYSGHVATTGTVMLSVLPFFLGFQLALQAVLIEIQESPR
jgi:glycosyltransferase involved in cell wall biosynthesis